METKGKLEASGNLHTLVAAWGEPLVTVLRFRSLLKALTSPSAY